MTIVVDIVLVSVFAFSTLSNLYGLPGNFIIALSSLFYGITTGFEHFSLSFALTLFAVAILIEFLEFLLIAFTARKYGSSRWGVIGAIIGGVVGALSGAFFTPVLGAIIGSVLGAFLGAFILEFIRNPNLKSGLLSGFGAFLGKLGGLTIKIIGSVTIASMVLTKII